MNAFKSPFILVLLQMFLGVLIAIFFGVNEHIFKDRIEAGLQNNTKIQRMSGEEKSAALENEADKNWRYYQRFHFHSTGIGAMSMGVLLLLLISEAPLGSRKTAAYLVAIGGFLYPFVWLGAAEYGPLIGRGEAKEMFAFLGYMGGIFLLGIALSLYLICRYPLSPLQDASPTR